MSLFYSFYRRLCVMSAESGLNSRTASARKMNTGLENKYSPFNQQIARLTHDLGARHMPSPFDKKMLVWAKIYKSVEEVPKQVTVVQMKRARDYARIRINLYMAAATAVAAVGVICYAKWHVGTGDSLRNRGLQYEKEMQEIGRRKRGEAAK